MCSTRTTINTRNTINLCHHHHLHLHFPLIIIIIISSSLKKFLSFIEQFHSFRLIIPELIMYQTVSMQFSCQLSLQWTRKRSKTCWAHQGTISVFRHFGRFWSPNSDLDVGQVGANCATFWRVKIHVHSSPYHANVIFRQHLAIFQEDPPEKHCRPNRNRG